MLAGLRARIPKIPIKASAKRDLGVLKNHLLPLRNLIVLDLGMLILPELRFPNYACRKIDGSVRQSQTLA